MPQPNHPHAPINVVQLTDAHLFADPAGTLLGLNTRGSLQHVIDQVHREQPAIDLLLHRRPVAGCQRDGLSRLCRDDGDAARASPLAAGQP